MVFYFFLIVSGSEGISLFLYKMKSNVDYRGSSSQGSIKLLHDVYKDNSPCLATIYYWVQNFRHGWQSVFKYKRAGRPPEISDDKRDLMHKSSSGIFLVSFPLTSFIKPLPYTRSTIVI
jgi:hypothetical protein